MEATAVARDIGRKVQGERRARGLTQKQLAEAAGVSDRLVRSLEMGTARGVGLENLVHVLSVLDLDLTVCDAASGKPAAATSTLSQGSEYSALLQRALGQWDGSEGGDE
ncbi:helix-turn-helix domain-containing protein [Adlercreutzia sp. R25]|uniref:helix-turn-helix domain-containing protein n=1 Tax=Adlercreutzia shanghongiae TaxID=3111773 RepID=UPI002DB86D6D|nr:helix-turn-helix domain-containing protein [Adlercreutzia sp. R25]MEC4272860.1 helix-turn-helix domain-containing protein [Adlercreutzia sp. R25]